MTERRSSGRSERFAVRSVRTSARTFTHSSGEACSTAVRTGRKRSASCAKRRFAACPLTSSQRSGRGSTVETFAVIEEADMSIEDYLAGKYALGLVEGSIAAATVAPVQALEHATIGLVASAVAEFVYGSTFELHLVEDEEELIAAAAPPLAPGEWFAPPKFRSLQPLRIDKDGRISGHLAPWNGCHTGFEGICRRPPSSPSNYAVFNVGEIETAEGEFISVGKLMFSDEGGKHAPLGISAARVAKHYDNATKIAGFVRAGADEHGIWLAGTLRTGLSRDEVGLIRANPPSGDWRRVNGQLDLVAAFCVCVPGYVVPRADLGMVASAEGEFALDALILGPMVASGEISEFDELPDRADRRGHRDRRNGSRGSRRSSA